VSERVESNRSHWQDKRHDGEARSMSTEDSVELQRMRWRCRRGLLELDIVLGRFVEHRYPTLNEQQRVSFDELLDLADNDLWDMVTGNKELTQAHQREVLDWLKQA
jgi:antitoxin CptB